MNPRKKLLLIAVVFTLALLANWLLSYIYSKVLHLSNATFLSAYLLTTASLAGSLAYKQLLKQSKK